MKVQYDKLMLMLWRMKITQFYKVLDDDAEDFTDKQKGCISISRSLSVFRNST